MKERCLTSDNCEFFGVITSTDSVGGEFTQDYNNHKVKNNESLWKLIGHKMFFFILE